LGTLAATQTLVDAELNQMLISVGAVDYLRKQQYAELLLRAEQRSTPRRPWKSEFAPSNIRVEVRPVPPVPANATAFLEWLQTDERCFSLGADTPPRYERRKDRPGCFDWVPTRATRSGGSAMVGGPKVARVIEEIRKLAQAPRPTALLLVGETGVGKGAQRLDMRHPGGPKGFIADVLEREGGNRTAPIGLLCRSGKRSGQMQLAPDPVDAGRRRRQPSQCMCG
jgi:hypothetical protein